MLPQGTAVLAKCSLLNNHPNLGVNWVSEDDTQWTPLHIASIRGHLEVVKLLLAHPNINVNLKDNDGQTLFLLGCLNGHVLVVRVLLKDPRVDVTLEDCNDRTPLWFASYYGGARSG